MGPSDHEPSMRLDSFRVGVDIGGTFTDIIMHGSDGSLRQLKVPSTPSRFEQAIIQGLQHLLHDANGRPGMLSTVTHGTTIATNTILEGRGAVTALLTTQGFRDVLELGRLRYPVLHDLSWEKLKPLVPRRYRLEVAERINANGEIEQAPDLDQVTALVVTLRQQGIQSIAVCFINSYANPHNEKRVAEWLRAKFPDLHVSASFEILPEIKEYERTSTTVVNAYIHQIIDGYLGNLEKELRSLGIECPLLMMQSNGGLVDAKTARSKPVQLVESGPAAGVTAACFLARKLDLPNVIAFDMGGTTAKASLVESGQPFEAPEYEVGGGMNTRRSLMKGSGYTVRVPSIDIAEVGAGGGSVVWIDDGNAPHVGPHSAGAVPGPACYGHGGTLPTLTDAAVVLGFLNPESLAGGTQKIHQALAVDVIGKQVAEPLHLSLLEAAYGVYTIAVANMSSVIRAVSSERGRDPRDFVLMAFGGAGPLHAVEMARSFEMPTVIVPISPGLFSTMGLLMANIQYHSIRSYAARAELDAEVIEAAFADMEACTLHDLEVMGYRPDHVRLGRFADMRYAGQSYELKIPVPSHPLTHRDLRQLRSQFGLEYERTYGHQTPDQQTEIVNLRLRATCSPPDARSSDVFGEREELPPNTPEITRDAYFGPDVGVLATPILSRWHLQSKPRPGPLIVEDMDATTLVPPHSWAYQDSFGNIVIQIG